MNRARKSERIFASIRIHTGGKKGTAHARPRWIAGSQPFYLGQTSQSQEQGGSDKKKKKKKQNAQNRIRKRIEKITLLIKNVKKLSDFVYETDCSTSSNEH